MAYIYLKMYYLLNLWLVPVNKSVNSRYNPNFIKCYLPLLFVTKGKTKVFEILMTFVYLNNNVHLLYLGLYLFI